MITFENWEIRVFGGLAHQYDNLSRRLEVLGDLPEGWDWTMLVQVDDHMDLIPLTPMEGGIGADLSREQLALAGIYELQLRGSQGDRVRHSNTEYVQVFHSLSGDVQWPEIPTQFTQLEQRIQEVNSHPPIPGENRFWLVWDVEKDEYIESEYPLPSGNGSSSSGTDGGYYIPGVDETTGLLTFTPSKEGMPAVAAANVRGPQGENGEAGPKGDKGDMGPQGPAGADGKDGAGLDVTGASVGQTVRIAAVDSNGIPTAWEPADLPEGGRSSEWKTAMEYAAITEDISTLSVNVPNATEIEVYLVGYAQNSDNSATDGITDFNLKTNNDIVGRFSMYVRSSGASYARYIKLALVDSEVSAIKAESSSASYSSFANVLRNDRRSVTTPINTFSIVPVTSGMLLKAGTKIGVRYR